MMSYIRLLLQNAEYSTAISTLAMKTPCKAADLPRMSRLCQLLVLCIDLCLPRVIAVQHVSNISVLAPTTTNYDFPNAATAETLGTPFPYYFPKLGQSAADLFPMPDCNGFVLEEATIDQLQDAMGNGQLTSLQITLCYLQRIQQIDEYVKYAFMSLLITIRFISTVYRVSIPTRPVDAEGFSVNVFALLYPLNFLQKPHLLNLILSTPDQTKAQYSR